MSLLRPVFSYGLLAAANLCLIAEGYAQSFSFTAPTTPVTVQEGDDFATNQLQNPWDFNERRDIGWEESFSGSSVGVSGGIWSGTAADAGAYFFPLFGGFKGSLTQAEGLPGDRELPRYGINHPVDTSRYTMMAMRMNSSSRSFQAVHWKNNLTGTLWPDGTNYVLTSESFNNNGNIHLRSGYHLYVHDLTSPGSFFNSAGSWSGSVYAIRVDPSTSGAAGTTTQLDWMRLVDPNSAPTQTISWSNTGLTAGSLVTLWVDTDNTGYDGTPIAFYPSGTNPGSYSLKTAIFPPGTYYFYLTSQVGAGLTTETQSAYSVALTVTAAPRVVVSTPSQTSGGEYSEDELGNAWDMAGSDDIDNIADTSWPQTSRQFTGESFSNSQFVATAESPYPGFLNTDVQVHLNLKTTAGAPKPIKSSKYRYLTYGMWVDPTNYPTISDKVSQGWVSRIKFWDFELNPDAGKGADTLDHPIYEGWHSYTIDMWNNDNLLVSGQRWDAMPIWRHLRLDPLETTINTQFAFDYVKLNAENVTENDTFTAEWTIADSDSTTFSTAIYYDTDQSGFDGTLIANRTGLAVGAQSYNFSTSSLNVGQRYYLYFVTSDGTNSSRVYSSVPFLVGERTPLPKITRVPMDYDADGKSDPTVYRIVKTKNRRSKKISSSGTFYALGSYAGAVTNHKTGDKTAKGVLGDFDGDGQADFTSVTVRGGRLTWKIKRSFSRIESGVNFGSKGDTTVPCDYDGDGIDNIAVFKNGVWQVRPAAGGSVSVSWGQAGDTPVPGDYDGDSKCDYAVWRPSTGSWLILNSSFGAVGGAAEASTEIAFGSAGDIPVQGDWDADGKTDTAVYTSAGVWRLREIDSGSIEEFSWGASNSTPVVGDFDGDGALDLTYWVKNGATWQHNNRRGTTWSTVHGKKSDKIPS